MIKSKSSVYIQVKEITKENKKTIYIFIYTHTHRHMSEPLLLKWKTKKDRDTLFCFFFNS